MMNTNNRLIRAQKTVSKMISLYCQAHHGTRRNTLCTECQDLETYAHLRIKRCPFGTDKPTCAKCSVHCYTPVRCEQIRQVMRYAGPRMLLRHPLLATFHFFDSLRKPPTR